MFRIVRLCSVCGPVRSVVVTRSTAALVTGCSSGIGRATALALAEAGFPTYATARGIDSLAPLVAAGCTALACDVTDEASMSEAVAAVEAEHAAVGVLVNNAGYTEYGPLEEVGLDRWRREFETNVFGLVRMTQLALPGMRRQRWGRVVNMSSMGGQMSLPGGSAYHASKYAVEALSDVLRFEVAPFGIEVVVVQPGVIKTRFMDNALGPEPPAPPTGPYAGLVRMLDQRARAAYATTAKGASAQDVAGVVVKAVTAAHPATRYKVTAAARIVPAVRAVLPDRAWDRLLRRQFPTHG